MSYVNQLEDWCEEAGYDPPYYTSRYFEASVVVAGRRYAMLGNYLDQANEKAAEVALTAIQADYQYGAMPPSSTLPTYRHPHRV
jgi:hypothetical protein